MIVRNPIFIDGRFFGLAITVLDVNIIMEEIFSSYDLNLLSINIFDSDGNLFWGNTDIEQAYIVDYFYFEDTYWKIQLGNNFGTQINIANILIIVLMSFFVLLITFLSSYMLGYSLRLGKDVEKKTIQLTSLNDKLQKEIERRKKTEKCLKKSLEEKEILLKEVHHRMKNHMTSISSMLQFQRDSLEDTLSSAILKEAENRVLSIVELYEQLLQSDNFVNLSLKRYLSDLIGRVQHIFDSEYIVELEKEIEDFMVDSRTAFSLGLIVNELLTNCYKYAFKQKKNGRIRIISGIHENTLVLKVDDNGTEQNKSESLAKEGLGLMFVKLMVEQLSGTINLNKENGREYTISFPWKII